MLQILAQKAAETTGDLIGNEIADKINSIGKTKSKKNKKRKKDKANEIQEICVPPEKR